MTTTVVNKHDATVFYDVDIMRPGRWGNPFEIGKDGDRYEVIDKHREWIWHETKLLADLGELRGKVLGCCCSPKACHGDTLAALADMPLIDLIKGALATAVKPDYIDEWLAKPNEHYGDMVPLNMIEQGDIKPIWQTIWILTSGVPS